MRLKTIPIDLQEGSLLCVVGPTASQKTELAIRICEQVDGEVIGADSVQIYKHFDVGSGKPTQQELARAVHHLVGTCNPLEPVDASMFARQAQAKIETIRARGKVPVVCGGTFMWVRALVHGLADAPAACGELRARLAQEANELGVPALHQKLQKVDPETASRLSPNDFVRIERALEVFELCGRKLSDLHREHQQRGPRYQPQYVGIQWNPEALEKRMKKRARQWLRTGWIEEVERLLKMGYRETRPMASVGYRQVVQYIDGKMGEEDLLERVVRATKIFARRQRTWLRDEAVAWREPLT
ncbi:MAG: tRNA (adenosine(37)-N6)-dimethylallyltransferase MiaA [Sorangium cellulosum]|nr:MAG: tRNA (adenosine(37)-N6)-dimethylallyltransferase MiaA [Sorangium cellulosum]